jgi:hypothetical protein
MRKTIILGTFLVLFSCFALRAQGQLTNLVFFSENGEHFSVVLNGILQNGKPETNIKIVRLPAPSYKLKIIFVGTKIPDINKTLIFQQGTETTFVIRKNSKGVYVIRFMNQVDLAQVPPSPSDQIIVPYTSVPAPSITINQTNTVNQTNIIQGGPIVTNPVNASPTPTGGVITINNETQQTNPSSGDQQPQADGQHSREINPHNTFDPHKNPYKMPGYHGKIGCPYPMTEDDFKSMKESINSKSFEDSKLQVAKQVTEVNCMLASQIKEILTLFNFEATRLEFAKYAYDHTYDLSNYYKVKDAFQFEGSGRELDGYIKEKK